MITSSGRSLWLRFVSDGTIEYSGFRAVYEYVLNPMEIIPFIPKCEFEIGGAMDFIGELWSMNVLFIPTYLFWKTTQFYQLKDLLFSVDWSFIVEKNIWAMESCGGFVLCLGSEKIILEKSRTRGKSEWEESF